MSDHSDDADAAEPFPKRSLGQRIADGVRKGAQTFKAKIVAPVAEQLELSLARWKGQEKEIDFSIDLTHETVWATEQQIADLFGIDRSVAGKHIRNVFSDNELEDSPATRAKFAQVRNEGGREVRRDVDHYSLDVILAVGYRVSSRKATEFRRWATSTLKAYLVEGYALNERRLQSNPDALKRLAARVRELRNDEQNIYAAVRECFKLSASDYDKDSPEARRFYQTMQDKFLYAVARGTAPEIILARADGQKDNMGLTCIKGSLPTVVDATVGKNYLDADELYTLHILCEQFLLYTESKAMRGQQVTMSHLMGKLDQLLTTNEYPIFEGYTGQYLRDKAERHARIELDRYRQRTQPRKLAISDKLHTSEPRRKLTYRRESPRL